MSTEVIFFFAVGVFLLMCAGVFMTMIEFNKLTNDPSIRKGADAQPEAQERPARADLRVVQQEANKRENSNAA
ncbi:MAG: hypothetical protein OEU86_05670 [Gammaproteobacteria bacterium]|nr:hypothetical protein [Gammaproteobacteria bacterium]